jgi:hypothetical protein
MMSQLFPSKMTAEGPKEIFLSCFKCGRIVKSSDTECPRCGLQFGPGTLFECPFCCGLVWRNATTCSTCGIDLAKFSESVEKSSECFDMDEFVDNIITTELEEIKSTVRRVSCPGCGLMIRGDESKCPRCDLPLEEAEADCPVCGEKLAISSKSCPNCQAVFETAPEVAEEAPKPKKPAPKKAAPAKKEVHIPAEAKPKPAKKLAAPKKAPKKSKGKVPKDE